MGRLLLYGQILVGAFVFAVALNAQLPTPAGQEMAANSADNPMPSGRGSDVHANRPSLSEEQIGDLHEARREYQAAVEAYSSVQQPSTAVWNKMGIAYQMLFDEKDAERCYEESLKLEPNNVYALNNLATIEDSLRKYSEAERNYRKALRLSPGSALILKNLGTNLLMQHQYGRGSDAYAQALAIDPRVFDTYDGPAIKTPAPAVERGTANYFKARSCARAGLTDCALTYLRKAFDEGSATLTGVANENDFETLRGKPEFDQLLGEQKEEVRSARNGKTSSPGSAFK